MAAIVIVGMGPRGVSLLERIGAHLALAVPELPAGSAASIEVHVVDPYPPGPGRIWRAEQSPLLRMNSLAMDTTLFTDESVRCAGPIRPGPTLAQWAVSDATDELGDAALVREAKSLRPMDFATRRLGGEYMRWCYRRAAAEVRTRARLDEHAASVVALHDLGDGRVEVVLDTGGAILADAVVLALGHLDAHPAGEVAELVAHAERHGLTYLPPEHAPDADLDRVAPGEEVIVRGFGLDFVDKLVLLTEGRGGRFFVREDGWYEYARSGREPVLHVGSRRGVPYHSKLDYELVGPRPQHPRFFTAEAAGALVRERDVLSFRRDAWPLIAKEIGWAYYHELFHGHPDRVRTTWAEFDAAMAALAWDEPGMSELVARAVPDARDRLDFEALDRPLAGRWFDDDADLQRWIHDHVAADVARRTDPAFSADLAAFYGFLAVFVQLPIVLGAPNLSGRSRVEDFERWWFGFFSSYASGPPPRRLRELLALHDAGVVTFIGAEMRAWWDAGGFHAASASSPRVVHARAMIDARVPEATVSASASTLLRQVVDAGHAVERILVDEDGSEFGLGQLHVTPGDLRLVRTDGRADAAIFAVGPHSTARAPIFGRPGTNSVAQRHNDSVAGSVVAAVVGRLHAR